MDENNNGVWNPLEENSDPAFAPAEKASSDAKEVTFETQKNEAPQEYYVSGQTGANDYSQAFNTGQVMTLAEYAKLPELKSITRNINAAAILCYVSAGITIIMIIAAVAGGLRGSLNNVVSVYNIIDVAILLGAGLFLHLKRSFPAAIVILVYGAINVIAILVLTGSIGGWLPLLAGIFAVIYCNKLKKSYKEYLATGRVNTLV